MRANGRHSHFAPVCFVLLNHLLLVIPADARRDTYVLKPIVIESDVAMTHGQLTVHAPKGWFTCNARLGNEIGFRPSTCNGECPLLSVQVFHLGSSQPRTETGQARQYLDGMRRHEDDSVVMEKLRSFSIGGKQAALYHFHSSYIQERLTLFLLKDDLMVQIELRGRDFADIYGRVESLNEVAQMAWSSMRGTGESARGSQ